MEARNAGSSTQSREGALDPCSKSNPSVSLQFTAQAPTHPLCPEDMQQQKC